MALRRNLLFFMRSKSLQPLQLQVSSSSLCFNLRFSSVNILAPSDSDVNEICRVLSDHRHPHHDLESSLTPFSLKISTEVVEQVLKRCKGLGVSAHRFFLWSRGLPNFTHSSKSYHILIEILGRSRQFPLIWDLLFELRDGSGGNEIKSETFWLMFRAYCRARLPNDAIRTFGKMVDFGIDPGVEDFHQILLNLCGNSLMDDAVRFYNSWKSVDLKSYSILMKGWVDSGNPSEAVKVFNEMIVRCQPDVVAYNTYIGALCKLGDFAMAHKTFKDMEARGLKPDASSYAVLLRAYCEANDVGSVERVMYQMRRCNLVPNVFTYNCVIKLLCRNGKVDEAYEVFDEMVLKGVRPDIWSYNTILAIHCKLREVNKALRLLKRMYQEGDSFCPPDLHTYNMLLKMLIEVGRIDRAVEVWDGMFDKGFYPSSSTYAVMIHGLCKKNGKVEDAYKYFEMMIEEGIPPYLNTCNLLRDCLVKLDITERIHAIRLKMRQSTSVSIQELSDVMVEKRRRREAMKHKECDETSVGWMDVSKYLQRRQPEWEIPNYTITEEVEEGRE